MHRPTEDTARVRAVPLVGGEVLTLPALVRVEPDIEDRRSPDQVARAAAYVRG